MHVNKPGNTCYWIREINDAKSEKNMLQNVKIHLREPTEAGVKICVGGGCKGGSYSATKDRHQLGNIQKYLILSNRNALLWSRYLRMLQSIKEGSPACNFQSNSKKLTKLQLFCQLSRRQSVTKNKYDCSRSNLIVIDVFNFWGILSQVALRTPCKAFADNRRETGPEIVSENPF